MKDSSSLTRRDFEKTLFWAASVGAVAVPNPAACAGSAEEKETKAQPHPPSDADLLLDVISRRYAHEQLTPEILNHIRRDLRRAIIRGSILSRYPLKNSDQPGFVFSAYRAEENEDN